MSRLSDPRACPDCRTPLRGPGCPACGLVLQGPVAAELWRTMLHADALVGQLRRAPAAGPPASAAPASPAPDSPAPASPAPDSPAPDFPAPASPVPTAPPSYAPLPARPRPSALRGRSVAVVLLALGGLCLLVFAAIFLGVAWDLLGLAGRSLVMAAVTAAIAAAAVAVTRRGLRASAETLWTVVGGVLALDLVAARGAGLLGDLDAHQTSAVVGGALLVLGLAVSVTSRSTRSGLLVAPQVLGALGLGVAVAGQLVGGPSGAVRLVLAAALGLAAAALSARVLRLPALAIGSAVWAVVWWIRLLGWTVSVGGYGPEALRYADAVRPSVWGPFWWPSLAAAALAAVATWGAGTWAATRWGPARGGLATCLGAGATLAPLVLLLNAPTLTGAGATARVLALTLTVALLLAVVRLAPLPWARAAAAFAVLGGARLLVALATLPTGLVDPVAHPAAWLVVGVVTAGALVVLAGLAGRPVVAVPAAARSTVVAAVAAAVVAVLSLAAWDAVLAAGPAPTVAVTTGMVAAAATAGAAWWWRDQGVAPVLATVVSSWTVALALWQVELDPTDPLVAGAVTAVAAATVVAGWARDREGHETSALLLLGGGSATVSVAAYCWRAVAGLGLAEEALIFGAVAAVGLLVASGVRLRDPSRTGLVAVAGLTGLAGAAVAGTAEAAAPVLGIVAAALAVSAELQRRRAVRPAVPIEAAAVVALLAATARAWAGLPVPEAASLPAALLVLGAGAWRVRDRRVPSVVLAPGLVAVLLPSLLGALAEPVSLRGLVVAAAVLGTLGIGLLLRLSTPVVVGAAASAALVVAHLGPVAQAVPRWMLIGLVGVLLVVVGTAWESGVRRLGDARRYLAALR